MVNFNIEYLFNLIYYGIKNVISFFTHLEFSFAGSWLVTILAFLFLILAGIIIYTRIRIHEVEKSAEKKFKGHFSPIMRRPSANERWDKVERLFNSANPNDWRFAIIEADTMLDELITGLGYPGANLGERLKNINAGDFPTLQNAWEAHKVRNRIAHEGTNFVLSSKESEVTRRHFETIFKDAGII